MRELVRLAEDAQAHAREDMAALLDAHNAVLEAATPAWCARTRRAPAVRATAVRAPIHSFWGLTRI